MTVNGIPVSPSSLLSNVLMNRNLAEINGIPLFGILKIKADIVFQATATRQQLGRNSNEHSKKAGGGHRATGRQQEPASCKLTINARCLTSRTLISDHYASWSGAPIPTVINSDTPTATIINTDTA